jgi:hypothetical protein
MRVVMENNLKDHKEKGGNHKHEDCGNMVAITNCTENTAKISSTVSWNKMLISTSKMAFTVWYMHCLSGKTSGCLLHNHH